MTRQQHFTYTSSPRRPSTRPGAGSVKSFTRPLAVSKPQLANRRKILSARNTSRFLTSRTHLDVIPEEDEDDRRDLFRELDAYKDGSDLGREEEQMDWDDDTTFVSMLQDSPSDRQEREDLASLADKLKDAMKETKVPIKKHFFEAIVPTTARLRAVNAAVDKSVEPVFAEGLLTFDEISKRTEALSLKDESNTETVLEDSKTKIMNLCDQLNRTEADRAKLWTDFQQRVGDCTTRVTATLDQMPEQLEQKISYLEKRSKELDKDDGGLEKLQALLLQKRR